MFPPCPLFQTFIYMSEINEHDTFKAKIESLKIHVQKHEIRYWDFREQFKKLKVKTNHHWNKAL